MKKVATWKRVGQSGQNGFEEVSSVVAMRYNGEPLPIAPRVANALAVMHREGKVKVSSVSPSVASTRVMMAGLREVLRDIGVPYVIKRKEGHYYLIDKDTR